MSNPTAKPRFTRLNPTVAQVREGIAAQVCPWCGAGPFRRLASHTEQIHGIDKLALRDAAFVLKSARVCSEELSETLRLHPAHPLLFADRSHPGRHQLSSAGRQAKQEHARRFLPRGGGVKSPQGRANLSAFARSRSRRTNGTFLPLTAREEAER